MTQPNTQAPADEREAFEAWASDNGQWPKAVARNGENYLLAITQSYWSAWRAAWALQSVPSGQAGGDAGVEVEEIPREWRNALKKLAFMAQTAGGTAGADIGLIHAVTEAERLLKKPYRYTTPPAAVSADLEGLAHECWAAAQLAPGEGIEDGAGRIAAILSVQPVEPVHMRGLAAGILRNVVYNQMGQREEAMETERMLRAELSRLQAAGGQGVDERAAFEKWMSDDGKWPQAVERSANGGYKLLQAANAWNVWQARAQLTHPPAAPALVPLPYDRLTKLMAESGLSPSRISGHMQAALELFGRSIERAHGINGLTVGGDGGAKG